MLLLPTASFDMKISVDGLFFIGSQLVALSYTGKVAVWQSMTQHWQVTTSLYMYLPVEFKMIVDYQPRYLVISNDMLLCFVLHLKWPNIRDVPRFWRVVVMQMDFKSSKLVIFNF